MSTDTTLEIASNSLEDTEQIAAKIGASLKGGEIIELISDVGGGKTAFVRGLAKGTKSDDEVASPSFTISRHYEAGDKRFVIQHFDFYRLNDPGLIKIELAQSVGDPMIVVVVEWSDIVADILPEDRLQIRITPTGELTRILTLAAGPNHAHLLGGLE